MKIVIVDDEPLARERLRRMIQPLAGHTVVGEADDGASALRCVEQTLPDAVLLDVHMPGMDGLDVARALAATELPPAVIFVTAHSEHALSAHNSRAAGYLLKPVRRYDLAAALERARQPSRAQLEGLAGHDEHAEVFINARTREGFERVPLADVLYFWADQKYTTVYHRYGELLIEQSLSALERIHGDRFLRVHRKALVARHHITGLRLEGDDGPVLTLRHGSPPVPVSRRRLSDVRSLLDD